MNTNAIERIKGFACEVTQEQWNKLVKVADEVGVNVDRTSRRDGIDGGKYPIAGVSIRDNDIFTRTYVKSWEKIPFPSFLAKLKGEEQSDPFTASETREMARKKWEPKCGECVEVSNDEFTTCVQGIYVGYDHKLDHHVIRILDHTEYIGKSQVRQIQPSLTRSEAEAKLKELGVNVRIID